jgi:hypothetical protein
MVVLINKDGEPKHYTVLLMNIIDRLEDMSRSSATGVFEAVEKIKINPKGIHRGAEI